MRRTRTLIIGIIVFAICIMVNAEKLNPPKNIILFIGDGMGLSQITATENVKRNLTLKEFKNIGLATTYSQGKYVTDSAAAGTALASGQKTGYHMLGVDADTKEPIENIIEFASKNKLSTGVVVTSSITDATPAAFLTHLDDRDKTEELVQQLAELTCLNVFFGGGWENFIPNTVDGGKRTDGKNIIEEMSKTKNVITSPEEFRKLGNDKDVIGLLYPGYTPRAKDADISLGEMTQKAIDILSKNENGFFLMVEGSLIDDAGHFGELDFLLSEMIEFDDAIKVGLDFAKKNEDTLVIATADHETGGLTLLDGSRKDKTIEKVHYSTGDHSGVMVPVFSYGPGSERFIGMIDNTDIGNGMFDLIDQSVKYVAKEKEIDTVA